MRMRNDLEEPNNALDRGGPTVAQSPSHPRDVSTCSSHTGHTIEVTHRNSHSGGASHSDEVTSDAQGLPDQSEMRDERSIVGLSRSSHDETKQVAPPAKRALSDGGQPSSNSSEECSFFVSKSTKTRGRPKIRKNQKQQVKKQRMVNSLKEAKQLVQGELTPVITLSNVARVLKSTYSYESAYEFLSKISVKTMGPRKKVIAKMVAPSEALSSVKFVTTEQFTHKCRKLLETYREALPDPKSPVGVRLAKIGVISEDQLKVMVEYHHTMKSLEAVSDTIEWMAATSLNRLDIPEGLNEYVELDKTKATTALQQVVLPISRLTPFGMVSNESVLLLREDLWLADGHSCGPLVLLFFESIVRDVVLPKSPSKALLRYYRMRYLLKSLHV
ncbi:hypothetical protein DVH05_001234 [Phytophthora capsici]|nr:hypothetical protein DVH05_021512 [Phytophthora capsici]KAG1713447.1 hypothetical protein DVH05_001234 [Phytophthora capsici]